jgi:hypothetical protein
MPLIARWLFGDVDDSVRAALMLALAGAAVSLLSQASSAESSTGLGRPDPVTTNTRIRNALREGVECFLDDAAGFVG